MGSPDTKGRTGWRAITGPAAASIQAEVDRLEDPDRQTVFIGNLLRDRAFSVHWAGVEGHSPINFVAIPDRHLEYMLMVVHPGGEFAEHAGNMSDEVCTVISGRGQIKLEDKWHDVGPWDTFHVRCGTWHALRNESSSTEDFVVWIVTAPPVNIRFRVGGWTVTKKIWEMLGLGK